MEKVKKKKNKKKKVYEMDRSDLRYAVVVRNQNDTLRRLPHHSDGVQENGHTHESVDIRLLTEAILSAKAGVEGIDKSIGERALRHLEKHAVAVGLGVLIERSDISEAGIEADCDRIARIKNDFDWHFLNEGVSWWDIPWLVDTFDYYVVARHSDKRYYEYTMTEIDNKFIFEKSHEVRKVYQHVTAAEESTISVPTVWETPLLYEPTTTNENTPWKVINVTNLAVESVANDVIDILALLNKTVDENDKTNTGEDINDDSTSE
tara:strand:- start:310 stop:1098 length:789 start_codon:yes stop_codon:yes gene_type:complete